MADDSDKMKFEFDLDAKEALGTLNEIKGALDRLAEVKSVDQLVTSFISLSTPIFAVGAAILAFKTAFDLTLEGEQIEKINQQFETLTAQAGLSSVEMKEGIEKAVGETISLNDALTLANKAIVELGPAASKLPQLFALARTATIAFGGTVQENFSGMAQAIATGNLRLLKHMGIIIDTDKAYRVYAQSVGTTVNAMSQSEKQQALMNAVLEKGKESFKGIGDNAGTATEAYQKLKVSITEIGEAFAAFVSKTGLVKGAMEGMASVFKGIANSIKADLGDGAEQANAKLFLLNRQLKELEESRDRAKAGNEGWLQKIFGGADVDLIEKRISSLKGQIAEVQTQKEAADKAAASTAPAVDPNKRLKVDEEALLKRSEQRSKFEKELVQMTAARVKEEIAVETDAEEFQNLLDEQRLTTEEQYDAKIKDIQQKGALGKELTAAQANELIEELEAEKNAKLLQYDTNLRDAQLQIYANQVAQAKTASDGIVAAFKQGGMQAQRDLNDFGKMGTTVFTAVSGGAKNFFIGLGQGAKSSGQLMKEFLFGSIADVAEAQGQLLLASGIGTFNPVQIAEGGALLALSGLLRSQAGGSSSGVESAGGGGGGAGGAAAAPVSAAAIAPVAQETPKKTVTVQFMGDYLETAQTQQRLVDLIRRETDVTDYKYQQIPVR